VITSKAHWVTGSISAGGEYVSGSFTLRGYWVRPNIYIQTGAVMIGVIASGSKSLTKTGAVMVGALATGSKSLTKSAAVKIGVVATGTKTLFQFVTQSLTVALNARTATVKQHLRSISVSTRTRSE
jgi:hypothetical protein